MPATFHPATFHPATFRKDATMSLAPLAAEMTHLELAQELPADPHARAATRARAARSVGGFVQASALDALDGLLDPEGPTAARAAADRATAHAELLDAEVARFRALADQTA
ncbi:hypothetical protein CKO28_06835 [Rhodovibrio sodomensis]|uniref:Uncharacterized protein n=1 Tax=Rhodovibrio sodomensis TaxID=1088 RepID=A0ABS1DCT2_9PROT|nr:hypothetical protein [Rhodovibrio sodomensis]MBK1667747.1 hypothetical protein [Rhodovibrio sodomensis]